MLSRLSDSIGRITSAVDGLWQTPVDPRIAPEAERPAAGASEDEGAGARPVGPS